jgi:hypothetical protein
MKKMTKARKVLFMKSNKIRKCTFECTMIRLRMFSDKPALPYSKKIIGQKCPKR